MSPPSNLVRSEAKRNKPEKEAITYAEKGKDESYILGKILDTQGLELIGATVYIDNTDIGSISDSKGNFKLSKYERGHQLVANHTGYKDQKVILGDSGFYQIVLQKQEIISKSKVKKLVAADKTKAYPAMGMDEFQIYVKDNMKFPLEVFRTSISGKTEVGFDVDMSGNLSNFIDKSNSCNECFKEAVRLLRGSGRWETKPFGTAYRTNYIFEF